MDILRDLNVPVFGTRFTLALVKKRLEEASLLDSTTLREVIPGRRIEIGPYEIEFIPVTHSTIDCVALAVRTPLGVIIHTGDFKIDHTPVNGAGFDVPTFARYGNEGVLALFSDSTNVERPGYTQSERAVVPRIEDLPLVAFEEHIPWNWTTWQQYRDAFNARGAAVNVVGLVGHSALRLYVMGQDALERAADPRIGEARR